MSGETISGHERKETQMVEATAAAYETIVIDHMPDGLYRDFCLWGISKRNSNRTDVLQLTGAVQTAKLSVRLFGDLYKGEACWERIVASCAPMHAWQLLEVISDNLAIGLAVHRINGENQPEVTRRTLLAAFNSLVARRLKGKDSAPEARNSLSNYSSEGVSLLNLHLAPQKLRSLAETFLRVKGGGALSDIEFAAIELLATNIEASLIMVKGVELESLRGLVRDSLSARYEHVNALLEPEEYSIEELLDGGAYTILGVPVLGYYIATLFQCLGMEHRLEPLIKTGRLARALYDASIISRLQNDLGAALLVFDEPRRRRLCDQLVERAGERNQESLNDFFTRIGKDYTSLNRIWKDASLGEFNICLRGIGQEITTRESITTFGQRLSHCVKAFDDHKARLGSELKMIEKDFEGSCISEIILRFLRFHEELYNGRYHDTIEGDYAVI
jgi:hypothetical protein